MLAVYVVHRDGDRRVMTSLCLCQGSCMPLIQYYPRLVAPGLLIGLNSKGGATNRGGLLIGGGLLTGGKVGIFDMVKN